MNAHAVMTDEARLARLRVQGGLSLRFAHGARGTVCARLHEADGYRARFPAHPDLCEAVVMNTGGGVAGGDHVAMHVTLGENAAACVTGVAAERIYRSEALPARIGITLDIASGAELGWLPEETILSSGARLERQISVEMAEEARLTLIDMLVLGRRGMGETMRAGALRDDWSVRRGGRLIQREALRLAGEIDRQMEHPARGGGHHVIGTLLHVAPDAGEALPAIRALLPAQDGLQIAASAWHGKLLVRALAGETDRLRKTFARIAARLLRQPLPRQWRMS